MTLEALRAKIQNFSWQESQCERHWHPNLDQRINYIFYETEKKIEDCAESAQMQANFSAFELSCLIIHKKESDNGCQITEQAITAFRVEERELLHKICDNLSEDFQQRHPNAKQQCLLWSAHSVSKLANEWRKGEVFEAPSITALKEERLKQLQTSFSLLSRQLELKDLPEGKAAIFRVLQAKLLKKIERTQKEIEEDLPCILGLSI